MTSSIPDKKHHMRMINTLEEYDFLTAIDPATLEPWQQEYQEERVKELELEAGIRSKLPYEIKKMIYRHLIPDFEPIDITRSENRVAPAYYTDPHAEFDYWRLTPFVYPTDNVYDAVPCMNAQKFVENILLDPNHTARLHTLDPPKQITFEVLIGWDFDPVFLPQISLGNVESLFDFLHVLGGNINHVKLKFMFKDTRVAYDTSPSSKKEIAPDNRGRLRIMKSKILDLLQTAMNRYRALLETPSTVSPMQKWGRYLDFQHATDVTTTDQEKYKQVRVWMADSCSDLLDDMWNSGYGRRAGFIKCHMLEAFRMPQEYYDRDAMVVLYRQNMGIPCLPLNKSLYFP
ncbi:unnamed protein product [Aureobasidium uvarum]|uniref:Uncharacterized protein n=1 Tax=Aureobasidium uvarum TaxID=2773716 RepID=A0A9N8PPK5_9PEZI|nr:unnamed protein product [Aureobasidium uvarum]